MIRLRLSPGFVDGLLAFPGLLLYLLIVTLAREWKMEGIYNDMVLIFALGFAFMPEVARLSRASVLAEKQKEYVEASRAVGDGRLHRANGLDVSRVVVGRRLLESQPGCLAEAILERSCQRGMIAHGQLDGRRQRDEQPWIGPVGEQAFAKR